MLLPIATPGARFVKAMGRNKFTFDLRPNAGRISGGRRVRTPDFATSASQTREVRLLAVRAATPRSGRRAAVPAGTGARGPIRRPQCVRASWNLITQLAQDRHERNQRQSRDGRVVVRLDFLEEDNPS
jgi:hypothetical protein